MGKLANKVAVVTGASKGIGAAVAERLGAEGAAVVVNYSSSKSDADKVVGRIVGAGGTAIAVGANLSKEADVKKLFDETKKAFGRVDILVNNAGVYQFSPVGETTPEFFHAIYDLNVLGLILSTKAAVELFPATGGSIINIGSVVSSVAPPQAVVYVSSKGAVDLVTRALAKELAPRKIRVNSINPGYIRTEGTAGMSGTDFEQQFIALTPLGRAGEPEDIALPAVFLASDDARFITGETLRVSGGAGT